MKRFIPAPLQLLLLISTGFGTLAYARGGSGGGQEDAVMVSNGQGVSSPSFWGGLSGQNPAGLTRNTSLKLQGAGSSDAGMKSVQPAAGILIGNGLLGAGIEYAGRSSNSQADTSQINWGIAGHLSAFSLGVSGHHLSTSSGGSYDLGGLIHLGQALRLGVLVPDFTNGIKTVGGGLTYSANSSVDLVIDASGNVTGGDPHLLFKPGMTIRLSNVQLTAAYGFGSDAGIDVVRKDFTGGVGFRLARAVLLEYEYQVESTHRIGLTLKLD